MKPKTHEYSRSLGRLLGREAAVSAIIERIERIGSSTKEAGLFHRLTAKSRPSKKISRFGRAGPARCLRWQSAIPTSASPSIARPEARYSVLSTKRGLRSYSMRSEQWAFKPPSAALESHLGNLLHPRVGPEE